MVVAAASDRPLTFGHSASDGALHTVAWIFAGLGVVALVMALVDRRILWKAT